MIRTQANVREDIVIYADGAVEDALRLHRSVIAGADRDMINGLIKEIEYDVRRLRDYWRELEEQEVRA